MSTIKSTLVLAFLLSLSFGIAQQTPAKKQSKVLQLLEQRLTSVMAKSLKTVLSFLKTENLSPLKA